MNTYTSIKSSLTYGRDLFQSGWEGARSTGEASLAGASLGSVLLRSARTSWAPAAVGAALGALTVSLGRKRRLASPVVVISGVVGAVIGLATGMGWGTRHIARDIARGAGRNMGEIRDAHWLARNPINYG